jgi:hypothetical protein
MLDTLRQDLHLALRTLRRQKGLTAAAVLSLGLGLGANTTLFTWMRAVLMEPLPGIPRAEELVVVRALDARDENISFSYPNSVDYRATPGVGFFVQEELALSLAADERADRVWGLVVSENYFEVLGVPAARGRALTSEDGRTPGAGAVVVISDGLWKRRFGGTPPSSAARSRSTAIRSRSSASRRRSSGGRWSA